MKDQFRSVIALLVMFQVLSSSVVNVFGLTPLDCLQAFDPNPSATEPVGLSDSSVFFATNYGTVGGPIDVRFVGGSIHEGDSASNFTRVTNPRISNCFLVGSELASISWGKSIDSSGEIIAIGAPTRKMLGQTQFYSAIDLYQVVPLAAAPEPPLTGKPPARDIEDWLAKAPGTEAAIGVPTHLVPTGPSLTRNASIEAINAPWLGLGLSLNQNGTSLASFYNDSHIAVFETESRTTSLFDPSTDVMLSLPTNFVPDSLAYRGETIAVTGTIQDVASATNCFASVAVYTRAGYWSSPTVTQLRTNTMVACGTGPNGLMPVRLSEDGAKVLVSVVAWETVFLADSLAIDTSKVSLANDGSVRSFGRSIDFAYTPVGAFASEMAFNVVTQDTILTFLAVDFIANNGNSSIIPPTIINQAAAVYPNRQQRPITPANVDLIYVASNSGFSVGIDRSGVALINPSALVGTQFHPDLNSFISCPPGFFQDGEGSNPSSAKWKPTESWPEEWANVSVTEPDPFLRSGGLQQPCAFCPAFTYQDQPGNHTCKFCEPGLFCPPGSAYPYEDEVLGTPEYENGQGEFETESIAEAFEELVINKLFSPSHASMIVVLTITAAAIFLLILYLFTLLPVGVRNFAAWVLNLFVYLNLPEEEDLVAGNISHNKHGHGHGHGGHDEHHEGAHHDDHANEHGHTEKAVSSSSPAHDSHAPGAGDHHDPHALAPAHNDHHGGEHSGAGHDEHDDEENHPICGSKVIHLHGAHCLTGFFNVIFLILVIAVLVFAVTFLSHYNAAEPCGKGVNNCVAVDDIHYTDGVRPEYSDGFTALGAVQANLFVDIIGLTGINPKGDPICSEATLFNVVVTGCTINSQVTRCNETTMFEIADVSEYTEEDVNTNEFLKPQAAHTCRLRWNIVLNTNFQTLMVTDFVLPAFVSWSSLRFWYLQSPKVFDDPTDPDHAVIQHEGYGVGQTNYVENVQRTTDGGAGSVAIDSYPPSLTIRQWQYGVLGREVQVSSDSPNPDTETDYYRTWWNFVTSSPSNATTISYRQFYTSTATSTIIRVQQESNYVNWRLQAVSKLIQPSLAFLTVLLVLIGVLHLVKFGLEITLVVLHSYHNFVHAGRQMHSAATTAIKRANTPHHGTGSLGHRKSHHEHGHDGHANGNGSVAPTESPDVAPSNSHGPIEVVVAPASGAPAGSSHEMMPLPGASTAPPQTEHTHSA